MKPAPFEYHAPSRTKEAVGLLADLGDSAKVIAGGQSLVPLLAIRLAVFDHLIDNRGTIGGSLAHADAAAEYPAVAVALDATIEALSPRGQRTIPATEFFTGIWSTALEPDEVLTGVTFPARGHREGFAVEEFARRVGDFAVAGAAVAVELDDDDGISRCRIGLFGLGPTPLRSVSAEALAVGASAHSPVIAQETGQAAVADLESVPSDSSGSVAYRKRVGAAIVATAVKRAIEEAMRG